MEWLIEAESLAKALCEPYKILILDTHVKQNM